MIADRTARVSLRLVVNGETTETAAATVADLVAEVGLEGAKVATAVNGAFVPARARPSTRLRDGDRVEIVAPRQGG
jgi:sulfur carrier protein